MSDCNLKDVRTAFGNHFKMYCQRNNIFPQKTKCGAFMVPDVRMLSECVDVINTHKKRVDREIYKLQKHNYRRKASNSHLYKCRAEQCELRKKCSAIQIKNKNDDNISRFANLHLEVYLYDTSSILTCRPLGGISQNYILNVAKNGLEIYEFILKRTVKNATIMNYEASSIVATSFLEQFRKRHKKFHYHSALKNLVGKDCTDEELTNGYQVTSKQLELFLLLVFHKVVPPKLFGKAKNAKRIRSAMLRFLNTSRMLPFDLKPVIESLDVESIEWLKPIECWGTRWLILAKFVKWFFNGFLIKILRSQLHITALSVHSKERVYMIRAEWYKLQKGFLKIKERSGALRPDIECDGWKPPLGVYKLKRKNNNIRPLLITKYEDKDMNDINVVFKFLKQLYITEYDSARFHERWKSAVRLKKSSKTKRTYLMSCDVSDAFGSVIQEHLFSIITSMCEDLPETLKLQYYALKSSTASKDSDPLCNRQFFSDSHLELPLPPGVLFSTAQSMGYQWIRKSWLLERIRKYIFYQRVEIKSRIYVISKGIAQGTILSPILSEIYYNFVISTEMRKFVKSGLIIRYMDDILYVTTSEATMKEFFEVTQKGIPRYNCRFNRTKTQSNMRCNGNQLVDTINFIGYVIDCNSLEVVPEIPKDDIRSFLSLHPRNSEESLQLLDERLCNLSVLKISKLALDHRINRRVTITRVIRDAGLSQARRASALILRLFSDVKEYVCLIMNIIDKSNKKIGRHVLRTFFRAGQLVNKVEAYKWNKITLRILRSCYRDVFKTNKVLRKHFIAFSS